ncbi:MAG: hypothetical protein ACYSRQ_01805 [Planctomycetota bacterium]|jgi:hypothetical protein
MNANVIKILTAVSLVLGMSFLAIAATDTDTQTVTITLEEIASIAASGDPATMTFVAPAVPGDLPADVSDNSTTMGWTSNVGAGTTRKITAQIDGLFTNIDLFATLTAAGSNGSSAGETQFAAATTDYDYVTGITNENPSGETITFRASMTAMTAPFTDQTQIVTWTLTEDS